MITEKMKKAGARALVSLGLQPSGFGADAIAETIFQAMCEAHPNPHAHHTDGPPDEDAYRRGYEHGAYHALLRCDNPDGMRAEWLRAIRRWRYELTQSKRTAPPEWPVNEWDAEYGVARKER